ncbi:MAG: class I tRNA ligase family protein, partial [Lactiplantibacillus plantarum]
DDAQAKANTQNVLAYVLDQILRLLHPIMPFVTEKIWLSMPHVGESLVVAAYPVDHPEFDDETAESDMASLIELITAVRSIRAEANAKMSSAVDLLIKTDNTRLQAVFKANEDYIQRFAHPKTLSIGADVVAPKLAMTQVISDAEVYIPLAELVDLDEEVKKLEKEQAKFESEVARATKKLGNERFVANAPEDVVNSEKEKLADNQTKLAALKQRLVDIKAEA